jgi:hypothetical protein
LLNPSSVWFGSLPPLLPHPPLPQISHGIQIRIDIKTQRAIDGTLAKLYSTFVATLGKYKRVYAFCCKELEAVSTVANSLGAYHPPCGARSDMQIDCLASPGQR